jgi:hypothetical protein
MSVNGLANIGAFMSRVPTANVDPAPPKSSQEAIVAKTVDNVREAYSKPGAGITIERCVAAAVREAFNLGHAAALAQNDMVEQLLKKQYDARTQLTLPAALAAIMEQIGMDELILDLTAVSTVFDRCKIDMAVNPVDEQGDLIEYKLTHFADEVQA